MNKPIEQAMTRENLVTVEGGISLEDAKKLLHQYKIEKLPVVDKKFHLKGLITIKDIEKAQKYPNSAKDSRGGSWSVRQWGSCLMTSTGCIPS